MKNKIIYTFRTFSGIENLKEKYGDVFVFGKLKEDFKKLKQIIEEKKPKYIIGIGNAKRTRIEKRATNKFNKNKINEKG